MERPDFFELKNGEKAKLAFSNQEYKNRITQLRKNMSDFTNIWNNPQPSS